MSSQFVIETRQNSESEWRVLSNVFDGRSRTRKEQEVMELNRDLGWQAVRIRNVER